MNASDHLTTSQISRFAAKALSVDDSHAVGGHLLICIDCRNLLPLPNAKQFFAAITTECDVEPAHISSRSPSSERSYSEALFGLFAKPSNLAWGLGGLVVIFGLVAWNSLRVASETRGEAEVARAAEIAPLVPIGAERKVATDDTKALSNATATEPERRSSTIRRNNSEANVDSRVGRTGTNRSLGVVSSVRGSKEPCAEGRTVAMELKSEKAELMLNWKPVPKATKYHLYISDENEILVDEFETETKTSYVLTKALSPTKSYKWKIVITLDNGMSLYSDAKKFSSNDFQSRSVPVRNQGKAHTRCLPN